MRSANRTLFVLFFLFAPLLSIRSEGETPSQQNTPQKSSSFTQKEKGRRLFILPVESETGSPEGDAEGKGFARYLAEKLRTYGYISTEKRRPFFSFRTSKISETNGRKNERGLIRLHVERLDYNHDNYQKLKLQSQEALARFLGADYTLSGSIHREEGSSEYSLSILLFDATENRSDSFKYKIDFDSESRVSEAVDQCAGDIIKTISTQKPVAFSIETEKPGALTYLDGLFLGRSPVTSAVVPGEYLLRIEEDGSSPHEERVLIEGGETFRVKTKSIRRNATLAVDSQPSEALVYLDAEFIGKTPLKRNDLPDGTHRLLIVKEGYREKSTGIVLKDFSEKSIQANLTQIDPQSTPYRGNRWFLDWSYYDLSFSLFISSLPFYGGYGYYRTRANERREDLRREATPVILGLGSIYQFPELLSRMTLYQYMLIKKNTREAERLEQKAKASAGIGIFSLFAGGIFLYLDLSEEPEMGKISHKREPLGFLAITESINFGRNPESNIKLGIRFRY